MPWLALFIHLAATYRPGEVFRPTPARRTAEAVTFRDADERGRTKMADGR
jgi:hypothetical protein